ncbi:hypothetical protein SGPA1_40765 [Streptomyces misionensis JCM 4497]
MPRPSRSVERHGVHPSVRAARGPARGLDGRAGPADRLWQRPDRAQQSAHHGLRHGRTRDRCLDTRDRCLHAVGARQPGRALRRVPRTHACRLDGGVPGDRDLGQRGSHRGDGHPLPHLRTARLGGPQRPRCRTGELPPGPHQRLPPDLHPARLPGRGLRERGRRPARPRPPARVGFGDDRHPAPRAERLGRADLLQPGGQRCQDGEAGRAADHPTGRAGPSEGGLDGRRGARLRELLVGLPDRVQPRLRALIRRADGEDTAGRLFSWAGMPDRFRKDPP